MLAASIDWRVPLWLFGAGMQEVFRDNQSTEGPYRASWDANDEADVHVSEPWHSHASGAFTVSLLQNICCRTDDAFPSFGSACGQIPSQ